MKDFGTVSGHVQEIRVDKLQERLTPQVPFPHRHDFYHLVAVYSGSGWHEIDFNRYPVRAGRLFLMKPGQVHSWQISDNAEGHVVEFGEEFLRSPGDERDRLQRVIHQIPDHLDLTRDRIPGKDGVAPLLNLMEGEYRKQASDFEEFLRHSLLALLTILARSAALERRESASEDSFLSRFSSLLEKHFMKEHSVRFYADRLGMTPKALTMKLHRTTGRSPRALIQERCLLEGRRLLAYSDLSVAKIGEELGFEDPNYFSRFFRKEAGQSPSAFRKKVGSSC